MTPKQIALVQDSFALLWTLEKGLGDGWTPEMADAWVTAYSTMSEYMISETYGRSRAAE
jgi:hemoglobin-like flavoprotein